MTPNSSCRFLSNGYRFELKPNNEVVCTPCCKWDGAGPAIQLGMPKQDFKKYREKIGSLDSYKSDFCHQCNYSKEKNLVDNMRRSSFDDIPADSEFGDPTFLEIQIDRTCNGACIVCGPHFSSLWQQELRKAGHVIPENPKIDFLRGIRFIADLDKVRKINFLGGESFLTDHDTRILKDIKHPEIVSIKYATNASVYPAEQRIGLWKNFQRVDVALSIDGINSRFDYIRYPLKWNQVTDNIKRMQDTLPSNVVFSLVHTVNIFNLYYFDEFEEWYKTLALPRNSMIYNPAFGLLSPLSVTPKLNESIRKKYPVGHCVISTINDTNLNPAEMLDYIAGIDQRRGLDWRCVFPEIADCFD